MRFRPRNTFRCSGSRASDRISPTEQVKEIETGQESLAHNGFITLGAVMRPDETRDPFVLDENGQPTTVRVKSLFQAVKLAWGRFDRNQIEPKRHVKQKHLIAKPVEFNRITRHPRLWPVRVPIWIQSGLSEEYVSALQYSSMNPSLPYHDAMLLPVG